VAYRYRAIVLAPLMTTKELKWEMLHITGNVAYALSMRLADGAPRKV
jgi:hypothetical protein